MDIETINKQLAYLAETKSLIKLAISDRYSHIRRSFNDQHTFRGFPDYVKQIPTGFIDGSSFVTVTSRTVTNDDIDGGFGFGLTVPAEFKEMLSEYQAGIVAYAPTNGDDAGKIGILFGFFWGINDNPYDDGRYSVQFDCMGRYVSPAEDLVSVLAEQDTLIEEQKAMITELSTVLDNRTMGFSEEADTLVDTIVGEEAAE